MPTGHYEPRRAKTSPIPAAILTTILCCLLAGILALFVKAAYGQVPPEPSDPPKLAAHRGTTTAADENTLSAFRYALPYADVLETDVRWTKDNKMVIMHDATLDRTTNCTGKVTSRTLAYIKKCTTPRGQHPPSLRQFLIWVSAQNKEAELYLELKPTVTQAQAHQFVNEVASYAGLRFVTADSFSEANLSKVAVANDALPDEWAGRTLELGLGDKGDPRYSEPFRVCDHYGVYFGQHPYVTKGYVADLQQVCNPPTAVALWGHLDTNSEYESALALDPWILVVEDVKDARRWLESR
jgi:hypothetical protein